MKVGWVSFGSTSLPCSLSTRAAQSSPGSASAPTSSASSSRLASTMSTPVSSLIASRSGHPLPGRREVDRLAVALDLRRAEDPLDDAGDELLGERHHAVVVGAADEPLEHRELGVVLRRHPLVAEELAQLVDVLEAADDGALQVELGRDPQEEVAVERVVVRFERTRRGAAGEPLQDRRLQLDVAALVHVVADRRQHLRPQREDLARALVGHQVELALPVAGLDVGDAVEEVGRVAQRLGQQRALADARARAGRAWSRRGRPRRRRRRRCRGPRSARTPPPRARRGGRRPGSSRRGRGRRRRRSCRGSVARSAGRRPGRRTRSARPAPARRGRARRGSRRSWCGRGRSAGRGRCPSARRRSTFAPPLSASVEPAREAARSWGEADCHPLIAFM